MNAEKTLEPSHVAAPPETLFASLAALPRPAWILFIGTFLNKFGTFVVPFLALYLTANGFTVGQAGLAIAAYGVGNLLASLLGGHLADYLGRRKTIVLSMFSGAVMMLLLSQARNFPAILLFTMLTGLSNEFYRPASSALLADVVPPARRITAFATLPAFATRGIILEHGRITLFELLRYALAHDADAIDRVHPRLYLSAKEVTYEGFEHSWLKLMEKHFGINGYRLIKSKRLKF